MANFPHFTTPQKSMLASILEGYEGFNRPLNMMQEQQQRRLANEQMQIRNQFLPKGLEQEQERMRLANIFEQAREPYAEQLAKNEIGLGQAQIQNMNMGELGKMLRDVNQVTKEYGFDSPEAQLARQWFENKVKGKSDADHRTPQQKMAADLSGGDPEKYQALLKQLSGLPGERRENVPEGATQLEDLSAGERNEQVKRMTEDVKIGKSSEGALKIINELRRIQEQHPNLGNYFATALSKGDEPGWSEWIARKTGALSEKDVSALQKFRKLSNDLVVKGSESWGGRITDARMKLLSMTKPGAGNTAEANNYLFDRLEDELSPKVALGKKAKQGLENRYVVYQDFSDEEKPELSNILGQRKSGGGQQSMTLNGKTYSIPEELVEEFLAENPGAKRG